MQKKFILNLLLLLALNLIIKPFAIFGIDAQVQNKIGEANYGIYFTLLNLSFMFNILLDFGINNYTTKQIAKHPEKAKFHIEHISLFKLLLFFFYIGATCTLSLALQLNTKQYYYLGLLLLSQFFITQIGFLRSHFAGLHLFKTDALFSVLDRFLFILFGGIVLLLPSLNLEKFILSQVAAYALSFIIGFIVLRNNLGKITFQWDWSLVKSIFRSSLPYALLILLMMIYNRQDSFLLKLWHADGDYQIGIYAQSYRLIDALFMFGMLFANLLLPIFSRLIHHKSNELAGLVHFSNKTLLAATTSVFVISFFFNETILNLIYQNTTTESFQILPWLMSGFIGMGLTLIYGTLLTADGQLKKLNYVSFAAILINFSLNFLFIPLEGALGTAKSFALTQLMVGLINFLIARRVFGLKLNIGAQLNWLLFTFLLLCVGYFIPKNTIGLMVFTFYAISLVFLLKIIDLKQMKNILLEKNQGL